MNTDINRMRDWLAHWGEGNWTDATGSTVPIARAALSGLLDDFDALTIERDAYRSMLCDLLASAHPHPVEHPTMTKQWNRARELLKNGPTP